jgi:hypothetical protein
MAVIPEKSVVTKQSTGAYASSALQRFAWPVTSKKLSHEMWTAIISLNNINGMVFVMELYCVY